MGSKGPIVGSIQECPELIKERLFRFHFVDNVRGQTLPFAPEEIKLSKLSLEVTSSTESILSFSISGRANAVAKENGCLVRMIGPLTIR